MTDKVVIDAVANGIGYQLLCLSPRVLLPDCCLEALARTALLCFRDATKSPRTVDEITRVLGGGVR